MKPSPYYAWKVRMHDRALFVLFLVIVLFVGPHFIDDVEMEGDGY